MVFSWYEEYLHTFFNIVGSSSHSFFVLFNYIHRYCTSAFKCLSPEFLLLYFPNCHISGRQCSALFLLVLDNTYLDKMFLSLIPWTAPCHLSVLSQMNLFQGSGKDTYTYIHIYIFKLIYLFLFYSFKNLYDFFN